MELFNFLVLNDINSGIFNQRNVIQEMLLKIELPILFSFLNIYFHFAAVMILSNYILMNKLKEAKVRQANTNPQNTNEQQKASQGIILFKMSSANG